MTQFNTTLPPPGSPSASSQTVDSQYLARLRLVRTLILPLVRTYVPPREDDPQSGLKDEPLLPGEERLLWRALHKLALELGELGRSPDGKWPEVSPNADGEYPPL